MYGPKAGSIAFNFLKSGAEWSAFVCGGVCVRRVELMIDNLSLECKEIYHRQQKKSRRSGKGCLGGADLMDVFHYGVGGGH